MAKAKEPSKLFQKCCNCVDGLWFNWKQMKKYSNDPDIKRSFTPDENELFGIVKLAMYILKIDEYFDFKRWIYDKYGYDVGGASDRQISIEEWEAFDE